MNDQEIKQMIRAICPDLNLDGCYSHIMPRVTAEQLGKLLDVAERGENAETWSWGVVQFLQYGQKELVAAGMGRLIGLVKGSYDAAWVFLKVPHLTDEHRDMLVALITDSDHAAAVLAHAPNLAATHRDALVTRIIAAYDAAWLLAKASKLSDEQRDLLILLVTGSRDATWLLREAPNLSDENREHLAKVAS